MANTVSDPTSPPVCDVIVIGGGIIGRTVAFRLLTRGLSVTLVDPALPAPRTGERRYSGPASYCNAGHIATEQTVPISNLRFLFQAPFKLFAFGGALDLSWRRPGSWIDWLRSAVPACFCSVRGAAALTALLGEAMPAWRRFASDLGMPEILVEDGHLMLWRNAAVGRRATGAWRRRSTGTATAQALEPATLAHLQRLLGWRPADGISFRGTGQVRDLNGLMDRLLKKLLVLDASIVTERAVAVTADAHGVVVTLGSGVRQQGQRAVVCAGAGSTALLATMGGRLPVAAERGYFIEWENAAVDGLPPLVFEERAIIVTRFGSRLRASSFVEFDAVDAPPDPRKWVRLHAQLKALGFVLPTEVTQGVGARPTLPDYLPAIGTWPGAPKVVVSTGHQHLGLTLAPLSAELTAALVLGEPSLINLAPFRAGRFTGKPRRQMPTRCTNRPSY